jgi:hypothetical protein
VTAAAAASVPKFVYVSVASIVPSAQPCLCHPHANTSVPWLFLHTLSLHSHLTASVIRDIFCD